MKWLSRARGIATNLFRHAHLEKDLDEEVRSYVDLLSDQKQAQGIEPEQARRAARIEAGGMEQIKEEVRSMRSGARLEALWQDLRYGARMLYQKPGFTILATLTLALGIGANTAIFSVVNAALLTPVPMPSPERVVMVWTENPARNWHGFPASIPDYLDWKASGVFAKLAAFTTDGFNLRIGQRTERVEGLKLTPEWFEIQRVKPHLGRTLEQMDAQPGHDKVALLGYDFWTSRFNADSAIVGRSAIIDGALCTIVGILPRKVAKFGKEQVYAPFVFKPPVATDRGTRFFGVVGRLRDGLSLAAAERRMSDVSARLAKQYTEDAGVSVRLQPIEEANVEDIEGLLLVLFGAVGFVLLVACANIANLLLVRATARRNEMAIRAALGASRLRLVSQLLSESVLLALLGGVVGILPALGGIYLIANFKLEGLPNTELITLNPSVLMFTFIVAIVTGVLFGLAPALQVWRTDSNEPLKDSTRSQTSRHQARLGHLFVVAQVAAAVVLLSGAGLMLRSFMYLRSANPGYDPHGVLMMKIALSGQRYDAPDKQTSFYVEALRRLSSLPGVRSAGATNAVPNGSDLHGSGLHLPDRPEPEPGTVPIVLVDSVTPDYFHTLRIALLRGRYFTEADRPNAPLAAIVDAELAKHYWPGQNPIGKQIKLGPKEPLLTIVGVVGDLEQNVLVKLRKGRLDQVYVPFAQAPKPQMSIVVSAQSDPARLTSAVRAAISAIDPDQPIFEMQTLDDARAGNQAPARLSTSLLGFFGGLALLLAAVGIYGVVSYRVGQRTRELGIRVALGAQRSDLLRLVLGKGGLMIFVGAVLGLAGALFLTRLMASLLYGISPRDPLTFSAVTLLLTGVGFLASYIPARRASKVDPTIALRCE
jgi:putative ABC transport system permease protein